MKKFILFSLFSCITFLQSFAQNKEYRHTGSVSAGMSLTGTFIKLFENPESGDLDIKRTPALQVSYDYGIQKFFSIGVAVAYQKFNVDGKDFIEFDEEGNVQTVDFNGDYSRLNVAIRPLFHYANNDKLDLYSGFRFGFLNNNFTYTDTTFEDLNLKDIELNNIKRLTFGITAFGLRYYVTNNIGAGFEINIGAPYATVFNINARF